MDWREMLAYLFTQHRGKLVGTLIGLGIGLLIAFFGLWRAVVILLLMVTGYLVGKSIDQSGGLDSFLKRLWGERR
ncbi:MAG: DUF2273 domain-containing protein [Clostridia bacterium]|nr:DUF2273 domain-containing protein [Clostridia bacterium]